MSGTNVGVAIAFDTKGSVARKWNNVRAKHMRDKDRGLSGAALEQAIAGIAVADPSLVRVQGAP